MDVAVVVTCVCFLIAGVLLAQLYVHYVESQIRKVRYSYVRYVVTFAALILTFVVVAEIGGFRKQSSWLVDVLPVGIMFASLVITARILLKKKKISFLGENHDS